MSIEAFKSGLVKEVNNEKILTENGATAYATAGSALVDLNFAISELRGASEASIASRFSKAFFENPELAVRWMFFARDARGGIGERRLFRACLKWLQDTRPEAVKKLIPLIAEYGREDDIFALADTSAWDSIVEHVKTKLAADVANMNAGKSVSLLGKWLPSENTSSPATRKLATRLSAALGMSKKEYRKTLSALRKHSDVTEVKTSANEWASIDYQRVSSQANLKYRNAFLRHDEARRREFLGKLASGDAKINSSVNFPHDIVHQYFSGYTSLKPADETLEQLWKALPDYVSDIDNGKLLAIADGSGSMYTRVNGTTCLASHIANALAIYFSEKLDGPFKDTYITFSNRPQFVDMSKAKTLRDKIAIMMTHDECSSTNIEAVFALLLDVAKKNGLKQKDIPNLLILSDMNFNQGVYIAHDEKTLMEGIADEWKRNGYEMPRITYWNICGGIDRHAPVPVQTSDSGVALVSGFSPAIAQMVYSNKTNPFDVLVEALSAERYDRITEAVKGVL